VEGEADFLREGVRALSQAIMEMEVEDHQGPAHHERSLSVETGAEGGDSRADAVGSRLRDMELRGKRFTLDRTHTRRELYGQKERLRKSSNDSCTGARH